MAALKPSLGLRTSQQLALTPQLQQSIRLLQMSTADLEQEVDRFLHENPLLEMAEPASSPEAPGPDDGPPDASDRADEGMAGSAESWSSGGSRAHNDDDDWWESQQSQPISLRQHLREQAHSLTLSDRDRAWLDTLIESLDDDGYLRDSLEELEESVADLFSETFGERLDADEIALGLKLLQSLDPRGVGARTLQECLLLQLAPRNHEADPDAEDADGPCRALATSIVSDMAHLNALGAKDFNGLCQALRCDKEALKASMQLIQRLNPKPGADFTEDAAESIVPDVIAYRLGTRRGSGRWQVRLNESAVPRLSINPLYAELIRQERASSMTAQLQEARWVIKNIQQRFDTILRVSQAIAIEQQAFFEQGEIAMRPLVLREIAERCELHESTVSRVTTNKYMLTPRGTFELKYFFTSHVRTEGGGAASSTALQAKIRQWIAEEDPRRPLSDQQISDRFSAEGIQVARRTIAKYREALRIEPVSQRKKL
ncbi:MAG: RNA polymerase factor sigma-54 [Betaproteobacteria bacterium]|nr:RNA polymerase factor sigma-54 [Betaproteobacteria bacterium]